MSGKGDSYRNRSRSKTSTEWSIISENTSNDDMRIRLVELYISIASKYVYMTITKLCEQNDIQYCYSCMKEIDKQDQFESGLLLCHSCHAENPVTFNHGMNRDDVAYVNTKDDSVSNFENALKKYMGLQDPPPDRVIQKLNKYMKAMGLPSNEDIKDLPLDEYNKRGNTSCSMLVKALCSIKEVKYYEDVHLIGSILWNWSLPDLGHLKDKILHHFRCTQKVFNAMRKDERGRNSALGIQFRLYAHLWAVGHKCRFSDFKIPNSPSSLEIHINNWRYMCKNSKVEELEKLEDLPVRIP